ncbi:MAG TPA: TonB-dependent receptor [Kofleriaceae bacterium]|nr:TonB-dependent receptor [Kofleriaceae bacterium]
MKPRHLLIAATLGTSGLVAHLHDPATARAQSTTSGAIQGVITDKATGEKLPGVTVTVTSPSLQGAQTALTDESGAYKISELPPGEYIVTFYYLDIRLERKGISVGVNKTTPVFQQLDQQKAGGEVVTITDSAPTIDPTSTTQGITIDKSYIKNIPVPGRTFEAALGAAAGSQGDALGVSFSGSTSLENQYIVDGVNTTGLSIGSVGSPIINDFIEEIEVITGGYNAEFGRATGGVINVVTKSGSNELKGSVFSTYKPGFLTAAAETTPVNAASIDAVSNNAYEFDVGFEVGGPIVKDRLWYFVGFVPRYEKTDITRTTKRQTDCHKLLSNGKLSGCNPALMSMGGNADGAPDVDPKTGFFVTDPLDSEVRSDATSTYNFLGKLNFAVTPEHQGQVSLTALPGSRRRDGIFGPIENGFKTSSLVTDLAFKWTSKFNDNKTEVEAVLGWHREKLTSGGLDPLAANKPLQVLQDGNLATWGSGFHSESQSTLTGCTDNTPDDPYRQITNCPMDSRSYVVGGPGTIDDDLEERRSARLSLTQRVKAGGSHELKAGLDTDSNLSDKARIYSGGAFIENIVGSSAVRVTRWVQLLGQAGSEAVMNNTDARFDNMCRTPNPNGGVTGTSSLSFVCDYLGGTVGSPGTQVHGDTLNWSAYLRDSWSIMPNLTLNLGLRYEEQRMRYSSGLQNKLDPLTEVPLGKNAMVLTGNWAPRVGVMYDWTKEGRSKIYTHYGRFYESIPMDINNRSFGGESSFQQLFLNAGRANRCGGGNDPAIGGPNGENCLKDDKLMGDQEQLIGASGVLVAPGIKSQYMDEIIGGVEFELLDDLKVGVAYQKRWLGRVIEDVSTDGANTYIIANPGEWSSGEERKLVDLINRTDDMREKTRLQKQLALFQGIRIFDKPRRDYNALQFTVTRRFSKKLYVQGSYTFSRTLGNYPGLYSPDNGQTDPNISSQYDLIELLANRIGPLPYDRPHYIKLDGYYTFPLQKQGDLTVGARLRALSGIPMNALAAHYLYGPNESFLLPRGELGRTDFEHGLDMHVGYERSLNKRMKMELYVDLYNVYDRQGMSGVDDNYAPAFKLTGPNASSGTAQNANPVSGGTYEDLIFVKTIDAQGTETAVPIGKNPNFRNTNQRYRPGYVQFGARLTF